MGEIIKIIFYILFGVLALYGFYCLGRGLYFLIKYGSTEVFKLRRGIAISLVVVSLIGGLITASISGDLKLFGDDSDKTETFDEVDAWVIAQDEVEARLKSPSTAEFCSMSSATIKRSGSTWTVEGYVDAQNSFGATLRNYFTVRIDVKDGGTQYRVQECSIY